MSTIKVDLEERSYDIIVESGILSKSGLEISKACRGKTAFVITESSIGELYGRDLMDSLDAAGFKRFVAEIPGGEACKTLETTAKLYDELLNARIDRSGVVIALGGGVVGDLAGFAAATYLRGIDFVQIPTTLLAQVDSSIGGKVGVDLPRGKNLIGAFYQPKLVITDPAILTTLPNRELASGLAEIIKHGIIAGQELFYFIQSKANVIRSLDRNALERVIVQSCEIKAAIVSSDEKESGLRATLNYGHTVGHGIEAAMGYAGYTHGEAVSIGMVTAALISEKIGLAASGTAKDILKTLEPFGLPVTIGADVNIDRVISAIRYDKKSVADGLRFVLPKKIGEVEIIENISETDVRQAIEEQQQLFRQDCEQVK